jgi:hypothetical protein
VSHTLERKLNRLRKPFRNVLFRVIKVKWIEQFISYYNNQRYHEALNSVTPADVYYGRHRENITRRELLKQQTLKARKHYNLSQLTAHNIS